MREEGKGEGGEGGGEMMAMDLGERRHCSLIISPIN